MSAWEGGRSDCAKEDATIFSYRRLSLLNGKQPLDAIIVVDMQAGLLNGLPKHNLQGVIERINLLTAMVRAQSGKVIWIRHCGKPGDGFERVAPDRVIVTGWATDSCVDSTIRSAISNDHHVVIVSDGHTVSDRPHLDAAAVIAHHHWVWSDLITNRSVRILTAGKLLDGDAA
jgi:nicotinamidase-related amidase